MGGRPGDAETLEAAAYQALPGSSALIPLDAQQKTPILAALPKLGHELRSPLAGIIGMTRVLLVKIDKGSVDNASLVRPLELIQSSARRSLSVVEHVVDAIKLDLGVLPAEPRDVDVRDVVLETTRQFRELAGSHGRVLAEDVPDHPVIATVDPAFLNRALRELIENGIKFTDGVQLRIGLSVLPEGPVVIEVADDGPGIPAGEQEHVFAPFERGERAVECDDNGAGLGLYLVRRLVDEMDARLTMRSEPGVGTVFTIVLPHVAAPGSGAGAAFGLSGRSSP